MKVPISPFFVLICMILSRSLFFKIYIKAVGKPNPKKAAIQELILHFDSLAYNKSITSKKAKADEKLPQHL